jgi:hypothetical protein
MTEQTPFTTGTDDTEGHVHMRPAEDTDGYRGTEDDTYGHRILVDGEDDTEGHRILKDEDDEDDTQGHRIL